MKIAIVHNFYRSNSPSGENNAVLAQIEVLSGAGHEVKLFATSSDGLEKSWFFKVEIAARVGLHVKDGLGLAEAINDFSPDVVHIHNLFPIISEQTLIGISAPKVATFHNFRSVCAGGTLSRKGGDCTSCLDHGTFEAIRHKCYRDSLIATLPLALATRDRGRTRPIFDKVKVAVALSEYARETIAQSFTGELGVTVIPNFSSKSLYFTNSINSYWVYVGRLSKEKGIIELLENWPRNEKLVIYGSGELESQVKDMSNQLPAVTYKGPLKHEDIHRELSKATGLIFPSICRENGPLIYLEALAVGLPVVAFHANVVAESIIADKSGEVFETWAEIPEKLKVITDSLSKYQRQALLASKTKYSSDAWLKKIEACYLAAVESL